MTDEMLDLARHNQAEAGVTNVRWLRGHIEEIPLPSDSVDVIISNCEIKPFPATSPRADLSDITITETQRVHAAASSAIFRATKPKSPASGSTVTSSGPGRPTACCSSSAQTTCCEPSAKSECCNGETHAAGTCGCSAGS